MPFPDRMLTWAGAGSLSPGFYVQDYIQVLTVPGLRAGPDPCPLPVPCLPQVFIGSLGFEATFMLLGARQVWVQILSPLHCCMVLGRWPDLSHLILLLFRVFKTFSPRSVLLPWLKTC